MWSGTGPAALTEEPGEKAGLLGKVELQGDVCEVDSAEEHCEGCEEGYPGEQR